MDNNELISTISDEDLRTWSEGTGKSPDDFPGNEGVAGRPPEADIVFSRPPAAQARPKAPTK